MGESAEMGEVRVVGERWEGRIRGATRLSAAGLVGLVLVLMVAGFLGSVERVTEGWRARWLQHFVPRPDGSLVYLDIDDLALSAVGRWPWDRGTMAKLVEELKSAGAKVVFLDVVFDRAAAKSGAGRAETGDARLARAMKDQGGVVLGAVADVKVGAGPGARMGREGRGALWPADELARAAWGVGVVDTVEEGGVVTGVPLGVVRNDGSIAPHAALAMACAAKGVKVKDVRWERGRVVIPVKGGDVVVPVREARVGGGRIGYVMDVPWFGTGDWTTMMDWPGHQRIVGHRSLVTAWAASKGDAGAGDQLKWMVNGKTVVVGWTATGAYDWYATPLHARCPGAVVVGTAYSGIMSGYVWRRWPEWGELLLAGMMGAWVVWAVGRRAGAGRVMGWVLLVGLGYFVLVCGVFDAWHLVLPVAPGLMVVWVGAIAVMQREGMRKAVRRLERIRGGRGAFPVVVKEVNVEDGEK